MTTAIATPPVPIRDDPAAIALADGLRLRPSYEVYDRLAALRKDDPALHEAVRRRLLLWRQAG